MSRSSWKGNFVDSKLLKYLFLINRNKIKSNFVMPIWSRESIILPSHVGYSFNIYNGKRYFILIIKENMIGHRFGEFSFTKKFGRSIHGELVSKKSSKGRGKKKKKK